MKIVVVNGSPRGENSNTLKITNAFIKGLNAISSNTVSILNIADKKIDHCRGCFSCWVNTPGECIIKDDVAQLLNIVIDADIVIWSMPLYYYGMPSKVKAFLDRHLPLNNSRIEKRSDGSCYHDLRHDLSDQKNILISTCGFCSIKNNYEAFVKQFEIIFSKDIAKILCVEGELFRADNFKKITSQYLANAKRAGVEFATNFKISADTQFELDQPILHPETFLELTNKSFEQVLNKTV